MIMLMKCVNCQSEAEAICKFCGRAVCMNCAGERVHKSGVAQSKHFTQSPRSCIVVNNAIWCRQCQVHIEE
ncbi:MAG: B-box zinc finger protein [Phycisphaeraceae bacterium JB051]